MKNLIKILFISKVLLLALIFSSQAASTTGQADVYKVTMKKVELCTASTGVSSCVGSVTLGSTSKVVDIASVSAGAAAATFGIPHYYLLEKLILI